MIARRSGKILLMGSASALRGMKRASTYSAARGAQLAYIQAVGVEVAPHQVQVNAIAQNFVENPTYFPPEVQANPKFQDRLQARGAAGPAGRRTRGRGVRRLSVQRRGQLLRRPGVPGLRRLGHALNARRARSARLRPAARRAATGRSPA